MLTLALNGDRLGGGVSLGAGHARPMRVASTDSAIRKWRMQPTSIALRNVVKNQEGKSHP